MRVQDIVALILGTIFVVCLTAILIVAILAEHGVFN